MHFILITSGAFIIYNYSFYYTKACEGNDFYASSQENSQKYFSDVLMPLMRSIWITFLILGFILFSVGCLMLRRLRMFYKDFYREFGCSLWFANVLLTLPLTFRAINDALMDDDAWVKYWLGGDYY